MNKVKMLLVASLVLTPCVTFAGGYGMSDADLLNAAKSKISAKEVLRMSSEAANQIPVSVQQRRNSVRYATPDSYFYQMNRRRGGVFSQYKRNQVPTYYRNYSNKEAYRKYLEDMKSVVENAPTTETTESK